VCAKIAELCTIALGAPIGGCGCDPPQLASIATAAQHVSA
jgi:hypothetical protein